MYECTRLPPDYAIHFRCVHVVLFEHVEHIHFSTEAPSIESLILCNSWRKLMAVSRQAQIEDRFMARRVGDEEGP